MGSRMVVKLLSEGHEVVVWNRSKERISNFQLLLKNNFSSKKQISNFKYKNNLKAAKNLQDLTGNLDSPRVVWLMVPARSTGSTSSLQASSVSVTGDATQEILDQVEKFIGKDDIVIDGGNAHFGDTQRRYEYFKKKGIHFLGIGVSGGIIAAEEGYPMMAGGAKKGYQYIRPILDSLAKSNGSHQYFGEGGAGHFVKMVHNGIEYGIMQSILHIIWI
ncbi:MAG: 6-phosphogluconate dehydrogenase, decarboxylating [Candidatus Curtissbacteria bacterium GW2011_GWC2_41_21]|nr:MAG: 6-phosphogluconate dehydrogenase, decarboxylating [Candidatus Curtissbacteria bacterium GW2011_GWC2_41_21]